MTLEREHGKNSVWTSCLNDTFCRVQPQRMDSEDLSVRTSGGAASSPAATSGSVSAPNGSTYINYQDDDECIDEAFDSGTGRAGGLGSSAGYTASTVVSNSAPSSTVRYIALYSFQVCH